MELAGTKSDNTMLPVEFFAAKDNAGLLSGLIMSVPCKCGLKRADTLRIDGLSMVALQARSILPIDLPELSKDSKERLVALAKTGNQLPVAEFMARGLFDAYFLKLVLV